MAMNPMVNSVKNAGIQAISFIFWQTFLKFWKKCLGISDKKSPNPKLLLMVQKSGSPVEVGSLPQYLQGFLTSQVVFSPDFWLPSTVRTIALKVNEGCVHLLYTIT